MHKAKKLLQSMYNNQQGWRIADLEVVARFFNVTVRKSGGSHVIFLHSDIEAILCVPARIPIKSIYIKKFIKWLEVLSTAES